MTNLIEIPGQGCVCTPAEQRVYRTPEEHFAYHAYVDDDEPFEDGVWVARIVLTGVILGFLTIAAGIVLIVGSVL